VRRIGATPGLTDSIAYDLLPSAGNVPGTPACHRRISPRALLAATEGRCHGRVKDMVTTARAVIENLAPADVAAELEHGDALLVDVREPAETARGVIPGAVRTRAG
jgi:hypothetical protein